jgi:hypothetical protein
MRDEFGGDVRAGNWPRLGEEIENLDDSVG